MLVCPSCGTENPPQARFCMSCAAPLPASAAPAAAETRKTVTVLFSDVVSSTVLGERLDPESLRRVMTRYFDTMRAALERHGGTVEKFIGDAVMAVFGIPTLHEDDALRAVRAAADMRTALHTLNGELQGSWGVMLQTRTGVNTGEVVAGDPSRGQNLVTGDTVNVAARLEQAATPGEILLGGPTYRLVRDAVVAEPTDPLSLKGKSAPLPAYRLLEVRPETPGHVRRLDSPMVGRERQLAMLQQAFDAARTDRACHLFTVLGAPGVGKSRLTQEFLSNLPTDTTVLHGRCLSYGEGITFWPVMEIIKAAAGIADDDPPGLARQKLSSLLPSGEEIVTDRLAGLLGLTDSTASPEETFWAVRKVFESMALQRPVVAVFDDIHWAEPTLLDLIEHLADWTRDAPLFLLCPARPELLDHRPGWGGGKFNATSILLEPLEPTAAEQLIDNLLGAARLEPAARERLLKAAEGTPLFVEEMLSMLIDDGLLRRDDGHWIPTTDLAQVQIPPTIQALLAARLDRLDGEERAVAESASIEGKVFHRGSVAELCPPEARPMLATHLMALTRRDLIGPDRAEFAGEDAFRFRHQLIRDAAYGGMPKERRADLHARFAAWLERAAGAAVHEYDEILGYHLEQAYRYRSELGPLTPADMQAGRRAAHHLAEAGQRATSRGDMNAATKLLDRAAMLLPESDPERVALALPRSYVRYALGNLAGAQGLLIDAADRAHALRDEVLEMSLRIEELIIRNSTDPESFSREVEDVKRRALELFERAGDHRGLARTWILEALRLNLTGHPPEMDQAEERAIEHARLAGDRALELEYTAHLAATIYWGGTPADRGIRRLEAMLETFGGHPDHEARITRFLAGFAGMQGRFDQARQLLAESTATSRDLGVEMAVATDAFIGGPLELWAGNPAAAEEMLRANCEALERMGERAWLCSLAAFLAEALYVQGKDDEAEHWTHVSEDVAGDDDLEAQADLRAVRAKVMARRGRHDEAARLIDEAVVLVAQTGEVGHEGDTYMDLAEVRALAGNPDGAAEALRAAIGYYEAKGNLVMAARARAQLGTAG